MTSPFAQMPDPPYYAVIFASTLRDNIVGYEEMAEEILALALKQPGCLGAESARNAEGFGITVSYWQDLDSIAAWRAESRHQIAQKHGIEDWYQHYQIRISKVERAYDGPHG